jgi:hypothetical protein
MSFRFPRKFPARRLRRLAVAGGAGLALGLTQAAPAGACAGLFAPGADIQLLRTSTLAAYHDGIEHYITSFSFTGGGAEVGSIVPLPDVPSSVERGGDWTLQRLERETAPPQAERLAATTADAFTAGESAEVLLEAEVDALDITVLKGGAAEVGRWALDNGFSLTPDAPEILDFYAKRSPIFMAARFDLTRAAERGQEVGTGTPVHVTIPTDRPWVPLRILGLGKSADEFVSADVYLMTGERPSLLPAPADAGLLRTYDQRASDLLLSDLRSDQGMEWVPEKMWLTKLSVSEAAGDLKYDLAIEPDGRGEPSAVDAGFPLPGGLGSGERFELASGTFPEPASDDVPLWLASGAAALTAAAFTLALVSIGRRRSPQP